jgi:hypothetical protein
MKHCDPIIGLALRLAQCFVIALLQASFSATNPLLKQSLMPNFARADRTDFGG